MAQKKIHKQEKPNKKEPTPQVKKIKDLRSTGLSLREISEKLNISRKKVEEVLADKTVEEVSPAIVKAPESKKAQVKKIEAKKETKKGK